ncbi:MAG: IclR family transcriptional regulator [Chloroflexota bacterium]
MSFHELNDDAPSRATPAISKAMRVLDVVAAADRPIGVSEIARNACLGKSTVHGLVVALVEQEMLALLPDQKRYLLGDAILRLADHHPQRGLLARAALEVERLSVETSCSLVWARRRNDHVEVLVSRHGAEDVSLTVRTGSMIPLCAGVLGKTYLAAVPAAEFDHALDQLTLSRYTDRSVTDDTLYRRHVRQAREQGYAIERDEYISGIAAVGCCVPVGANTYFLWCLALSADVSDGQLDDMGHRLLGAKNRLIDGNTGVLSERDGWST